MHEDGRVAEREMGEGEEGKSMEEIDREREARRRSIRVDSYDDRPRKDEGCCGCVVM